VVARGVRTDRERGIEAVDADVVLPPTTTRLCLMLWRLEATTCRSVTVGLAPDGTPRTPVIGSVADVGGTELEPLPPGKWEDGTHPECMTCI
jgi:hypothetical protein